MVIAVEKNHYELADNITIDDLKKVGFNEFKCENKTYISYYRCLYEEIDLHITFDITSSNIITFDEDKNVEVIDDEFGQYLSSFYSNTRNKYIDKVISRYNEEMNHLVNLGILKKILLDKDKQFIKIN